MNTNIFFHLLQDLSSFSMILNYLEILDILNYEYNIFFQKIKNSIKILSNFYKVDKLTFKHLIIK
jgi:hypothetical protein